MAGYKWRPLCVLWPKLGSPQWDCRSLCTIAKQDLIRVRETWSTCVFGCIHILIFLLWTLQCPEQTPLLMCLLLSVPSLCVCVVSHTVLLQALSPSSLMEMNVASSTLQRWFNHTNRQPKSPQCVRVPSLYTYESVCNTLCVIQNSCFGVRPQETEWDTEIEPISLCMKLQ